MSKAREWWIGERSLDAHPIAAWDENQNYIHVIEYASYQSIADLAEKFAAACMMQTPTTRALASRELEIHRALEAFSKWKDGEK